MSIVRIGLAETKKFAEGYESIFGKKKEGGKPAEAKKGGKKAAKPARKKGKK